MKYSITNQPELFEFHDSEVTGYELSGNTLTLTMTHLNIHNGIPENPYDSHMRITQALVEFEDFDLIWYTIGTTWLLDENGNSYPKEPVIYHSGEEGMKLLKTAMIDQFTVLGIHIEDERDYKTYEIDCIGYDEPYFGFKFRAKSMKISWDKYSSKAWYELTRQMFPYVTHIKNGEEYPEKLHILLSDQTPGEPYRSVGIEVGEKMIFGRGEVLSDALLSAEKKVYPQIKLKCCQTCRHGNFNPFGTEDEKEIFCLKDIQIKNKNDLCGYVNSGDDIRTMQLFDVCEEYIEMNKDHYVYNYYYHILYEEVSEEN